jgi:hypothetical protein
MNSLSLDFDSKDAESGAEQEPAAAEPEPE